jgi:hypothetical protein
MRFVAEVRFMGGGACPLLLALLSVAGLGSVAGASVSIFTVWRGAKKFFVATFADVSGSVTFLGVLAASSVECRFLLPTSLKPSVTLVCPVWLRVLRIFFSSFNITVYVPYSAVNSNLPRRVLEKFSLLSSAELTMAAHSSLSPTDGGFGDFLYAAEHFVQLQQ